MDVLAYLNSVEVRLHPDIHLVAFNIRRAVRLLSEDASLTKQASDETLSDLQAAHQSQKSSSRVFIDLAKITLVVAFVKTRVEHVHVNALSLVEYYA